MSKKEIKSTESGFVIVDEHDNVIEEFNEHEAINKLLKNTHEIKSLISEWVEYNKKYKERLNELTDEILNREKDTYTHELAKKIVKEINELTNN